MSDAPALSRLAAPPAARHLPPDDDAAIGRGLVNGLLLSLPLWALIGIGVAALF
ncbi:hypothetical protein [Roseomonas sp. CECT 9278]|uniref:hypothetical protein n=1 Tax=Roseomonas sp. CECT 9278 TaxID=2845823 RepID=UPI001E4ED816|nr:hypothetical protein [Roseomonas sp. CECT 9278]CAH0286855.1 hypothetical protein ROS9278_04111 [Roseomonas sp. CECT 9278]